jgi:hypothetical protein
MLLHWYRSIPCLRLCLTILPVALLGACAGDATAPVASQQLVASVTGSYSIRFIDGRRLPVLLCANDAKVTAGSLRLRSNNTFQASVWYRSPPTASQEIYRESGTFTRAPGSNRIVFHLASAPGTRWTGTLATDGSIRIRYLICGETHHAKVVRSP